MTDDTQSDGGSSSADSLVRGLVEALSDDGSKAVPMASTDTEEVIKSQLTENTGRHLLDSGGAFGRHWEENQDNPPWEQPAWNVETDFVTHNVYHFLRDSFTRDRASVALEVALYAFAYSDERARDPWLPCMESFAEAVQLGQFTVADLTDLGVPREAADTVVGLSRELAPDSREDVQAATHNTYNGQYHGLSQVLQGTNFGGPYAEYVMVQVHGGADVRGGYTAPRVYFAEYGAWWPHELHFECERCGWGDAESCVFREDSLIYQDAPNYEEVKSALSDRAPDGTPEEAVREAAVDIVEEGHSRDHQDGAVFHKCQDGVGHVHFS